MEGVLTESVLIAGISAVSAIAGTILGSLFGHIFSGRQAEAQWKRTLQLERERWEKERTTDREIWDRDREHDDRALRFDIYTKFHRSSVDVMEKGSLLRNKQSESDRGPDDERWLGYLAATKEHLSLHTQLALVTSSEEVRAAADDVHDTRLMGWSYVE